MKRTFLFCALLALLTGANAQETTDYKEKHPYKDWVKIAPKLDDAFFTTPEAIRIADNVLLYQQTTGGWPKNIYMPAELTADEYKKALAAKDNVNQSTIDNNATSTEIRYLSRVYLATDIEKYKEAALEGIRYILKAQYPNGGWPQFWPRPKGYYTHITYNDNAMVNVMNLLRDVYNKKAPYTYVPDTLCQRARAAFDKGVECILNTQVKQNGKLTVWCAQHDEHPRPRQGPCLRTSLTQRGRIGQHRPTVDVHPRSVTRNHRFRGSSHRMVQGKQDNRYHA